MFFSIRAMLQIILEKTNLLFRSGDKAGSMQSEGLLQTLKKFLNRHRLFAFDLHFE